jgi:hypothetical protein
VGSVILQEVARKHFSRVFNKTNNLLHDAALKLMVSNVCTDTGRPFMT